MLDNLCAKQNTNRQMGNFSNQIKVALESALLTALLEMKSTRAIEQILLSPQFFQATPLIVQINLTPTPMTFEGEKKLKHDTIF